MAVDMYRELIYYLEMTISIAYMQKSKYRFQTKGSNLYEIKVSISLFRIFHIEYKTYLENESLPNDKQVSMNCVISQQQKKRKELGTEIERKEKLVSLTIYIPPC